MMIVCVFMDFDEEQQQRILEKYDRVLKGKGKGEK